MLNQSSNKSNVLFFPSKFRVFVVTVMMASVVPGVRVLEVSHKGIPEICALVYDYILPPC